MNNGEHTNMKIKWEATIPKTSKRHWTQFIGQSKYFGPYQQSMVFYCSANLEYRPQKTRTFFTAWSNVQKPLNSIETETGVSAPAENKRIAQCTISIQELSDRRAHTEKWETAMDELSAMVMSIAELNDKPDNNDEIEGLNTIPKSDMIMEFLWLFCYPTSIDCKESQGIEEADICCGDIFY